MEVYLNNITGLGSAIESLYVSKRTWTPELRMEIHSIVNAYELSYKAKRLGLQKTDTKFIAEEETAQLNEWLDMVFRIGQKHTTILRYINVEFTTAGMHRAGVDDIDSHAERFHTRIIRSSTRAGRYESMEMSDYYRNIIYPADVMSSMLGIKLPDNVYMLSDGTFTVDKEKAQADPGGVREFVKAPNGYIDKLFKDNNDMRRGLYMESIPVTFVSAIDLLQWAHVFDQRNRHGNAHPEVKSWAEKVQDMIENVLPWYTREYVDGVRQ